jgi:hypothetical protein
LVGRVRLGHKPNRPIDIGGDKNIRIIVISVFCPVNGTDVVGIQERSKGTQPVHDKLELFGVKRLLGVIV